jgi:hypothetical protein
MLLRVRGANAGRRAGASNWEARATLRTILAMSIVAETVVAPFCLKPT